MNNEISQCYAVDVSAVAKWGSDPLVIDNLTAGWASMDPDIGNANCGRTRYGVFDPKGAKVNVPGSDLSSGWAYWSTLTKACESDPGMNQCYPKQGLNNTATILTSQCTDYVNKTQCCDSDGKCTDVGSAQCPANMTCPSGLHLETNKCMLGSSTRS